MAEALMTYGVPGPQGERGATDSQGPAGPVGPAGPSNGSAAYETRTSTVSERPYDSVRQLYHFTHRVYCSHSYKLVLIASPAIAGIHIISPNCTASFDRANGIETSTVSISGSTITAYVSVRSSTESAATFQIAGCY